MDRWEYLVTKEYKLRHHICEYFLDHTLDFVIDVGAYKATIESNDWVIPIDPLKSMPDSYHGTIKEWVNEHSDLLNKENYGVMALGLEIEGEESEWNSFLNLIESCKTAIIEFSKDHQPSVQQAQYILDNTSKEIMMEIDIAFPNVETVGFKPHANRKLIILKRK